jgi:microcystin-dependent protein
MADCTIRNYTSVIDRTECIGNSLVTINNNFESLDKEICDNTNRIDAIESATTGVPVGAIMPFAAIPTAQKIPAGWLVCDGQIVPSSSGSITQLGSVIINADFTNLYNYLGSTYGAPGRLPDLRGQFIRGWVGIPDDGGIDTGRVFGSSQEDAIKSHSHTGSTSTNGAHSHRYFAISEFPRGSQYDTGDERDDAKWNPHFTENAGAHSHSLNINNTGDAETRPKNISLLYCIKF